MSKQSGAGGDGPGMGSGAGAGLASLGTLLAPGSVVRQTASLSAASAAGQALLLLSAPVLTRLYPPTDFALYAVYAALVAVLGVVASGRLEMAIALPEREGSAATLARVAVVASLATGTLAAAVLGLAGPSLARALGAAALAPWFLPAAFSVALAGVARSLSFWWLRQGAAVRVATARGAQIVAMVGGQLLLGAFYGGGVRGLVLGVVLGQVVGLTMLVPGALGPLAGFGAGQGGEPVGSLLRRYRGMPLNAVQTSFLNALAKNLFPLVFLRALGAAATGLVTFAERLLTAPVEVVTQALWQVTHTRLGALESARRKALLIRIHGVLAFALAWPLALVAVFADLAGPVFGQEWSSLAAVLPWFAGMVYLNGVSNATSYFLAFQQYRAEVVFNASLVVVRLVALGVGLLYLGPMAAILLYAAVSGLFYLALNLWWGRFLGLSRRYLLHLGAGSAAALGGAGLCRASAAVSPWLAVALLAAITLGAVLVFGRRLLARSGGIAVG